MKGTCPICDGSVPVVENTQATEIITCPECDNQIVVESITNDKVILEEAPEVEEDWGQ